MVTENDVNPQQLAGSLAQKYANVMQKPDPAGLMAAEDAAKQPQPGDENYKSGASSQMAPEAPTPPAPASPEALPMEASPSEMPAPSSAASNPAFAAAIRQGMMAQR